MFWSLAPEVAGELGPDTVMDTSVHPPIVSKLQYRFQGWLGDDLLESFPCYVVTDALGSDLKAADFTGFDLDVVSIVTSEEFDEIEKEHFPGRQLPGFKWLKVTGQAGVEDFGLSVQHKMVVSDRVLATIRRRTLRQCDVELYVP